MARFTQNAGGSGSGSGSGSALNYVQVAGTQQTISSAPSTIVSLDITTTGSPVQISVTGEGSNASAGSWVRVNLFRDNTAIGNEIQVEASAVSENVPFAINFIDDVAAGTYNYSARVTSKSSGNWQFGEVAGPVINAVELTGFKGDDGADGTNGTNGADGSDGADGADALWNFLGEWQNGIDYAAGSVVEFQGSSYYHPDGQFSSYSPPTNGWLLVSSKGDTGENGADGADGSDGAPGADGNDGSPGLVYLGNYISGNGYVANLAVVKGSDNNLYIATSSGGLSDPVGNTAEWAIFLPKGADGAQGDPGPQGDPGADGADANLDTGTTTINSYNPVWSGTGLTYTNTPATGSYIKIGNLVIVQIDVLFTTVTNFGTGQYSLTLPFASRYHTDVYGGSVHRITNQGIDHYSLKGHLSPTSSTFTLWAIGSSAADQTFNNNTPVGIDTDDKFHMSFSYICE